VARQPFRDTSATATKEVLSTRSRGTPANIPRTRRGDDWTYSDSDQIPKLMIDVIGPTVQKNHWRVIGRTCFGVCNIQDAGIYLLERGERSIRSKPDRREAVVPVLSCSIAHPPTLSCRAEWPLSDASLSVLRFWECSWQPGSTADLGPSPSNSALPPTADVTGRCPDIR
jgi:hypothetical protein